MSVGLRAKQLALGLSLLVVSEPTVAQQNPFGNLIGGIIGGAITEGVRQEWSQMPPMLQLCYNVSLRRDNANVQSLIQSGIGPNDPRLSQIRAACDQLINRKFRTGFECNFQLGNRSITTWCDEAYATQARNGGLQRLSVEQAIQASGKGEQLSLGQFEKPDAERRRMQMMQVNPAATAVPKPLWDCDKANKASEKAICNSYQLTLIDIQYWQYWNLAKPLDKKREMQKKNTGFYRAGIACNGNEDCIKRNLITAIDTVAEFLKSNGTQVSTYSEQQEAIRKADDERRRVEDEQRRRVAEQQEALRKADDERRRVEDEQRRRVAEQQERERQRQREDDERRLAIAKAEAEKARAEAEIAKTKIEAEKAAALAQAEAAKAKLAAEEEARKNSLSGRLSSLFSSKPAEQAGVPQSKAAPQAVDPKLLTLNLQADDVKMDFKSNKFSASQKYNKASLYVGGVIKSIESSNGTARIDLLPHDNLLFASFGALLTPSTDQLDTAGKLTFGDYVTLSCVGIEAGIITPQSKSCQVISAPRIGLGKSEPKKIDTGVYSLKFARQKSEVFSDLGKDFEGEIFVKSSEAIQSLHVLIDANFGFRCAISPPNKGEFPTQIGTYTVRGTLAILDSKLAFVGCRFVKKD